MATATVAAGGVTTGRVTLVANDVLTVNFTDNISAASIWADGTADCWYTTDGSTPVVDQCRRIAGGAPTRVTVTTNNQAAGPLDVVKVLSTGTLMVVVERA